VYCSPPAKATVPSAYHRRRVNQNLVEKVLSTSNEILHVTLGILASQTGALPIKTYLLVLSCCSVYVEIGSIVCGLARQIMGSPGRLWGTKVAQKKTWPMPIFRN
jgi:hypothetical protein